MGVLVALVVGGWLYYSSNSETAQSSEFQAGEQIYDKSEILDWAVRFPSREACDDTCVEETLKKVASQEGPEKAIEYMGLAFKARPETGTQCHDYLHLIGKASAQADLGGDYLSPMCGYGYVHGYLQGRAAVVEGLDDFVKEVRDFCGILPKGADKHGCVHGAGHAMAAVVSDDLVKAATGCEGLREEYVASWCGEGLVMEYGKGAQKAAGWIESQPGDVRVVGEFLEKGAHDPNIDILEFCRTAKPWLAEPCYASLAMFVGPHHEMDFAGLGKLCVEVTAAKPSKACYKSVGSWVVEMGTRVGYVKHWPPQNSKDAEILANWIMDACNQVEDPEGCVYGSVSTAIHHLHDISYPEDLVPQVCPLLPAQQRFRCEYVYESHQADREVGVDVRPNSPGSGE